MSLFGLLSDVVEIATAPIKIAATATRVVTKPIAQLAKEVVEEVKDMVE